MGVDINWSLLQPVDVGGAFQAGLEKGRTRSALANLMTNPGDKGALSALSQYQPELAMKFEERGRQATQRAAFSNAFDPTTGRVDPTKARQAYAGAGDIDGAMDFDAHLTKQAAQMDERQKRQVAMGGRLLRGVKDDASFQAARQQAQMAGIDLTHVPEAYDPAWVDSYVRAADLLAERKVIEIGNDAYVYDPSDPRGTFEAVLETPDAPKGSWKERTLPDGSTEWFWLDEPGGGGAPVIGGGGAGPMPRAPASTAPAGAPPAAAVEKILTSQGLQVTSGARSPEDNRRVGGAEHSYHLSGRAVDIALEPGVTKQAVRETLEAQGYRIRELLGPGDPGHNDHIHVAFDPPAQPYQVASNGETPGPRTVRGSAPKAPEWTPRVAPDGTRYLENPRTGDRKADPSSPASDTKALRKAEADLRKEYNARPEVKEFADVRGAYNTINALTQGPATAANDMSLIFSYMKMLDPGSVVREGEFANAQNTAGVPDRIRNYYNKALNGQRLNPDQRSEFRQSAKTIYDTRKTRVDALGQEFRGYAEDYGVNPERVFTPDKAEAVDPRKQFGLSFYPSGAQGGWLQGAKRDTKAPLGARNNPVILDPAKADAKFGTLRTGQYFLDPDGKLRRKP